MKQKPIIVRFMKSEALALLWVVAITALIVAVVYTLATGISPLSVVGISPTASLVAMLSALGILSILPGILDAFRDR